MNDLKKKKGPGLSAQIILGMIAGAVAGVLLGPHAAPCGELGKLVITLIKAVAAPLLFLAIINAILSADVGLKNGVRMVFIAGFNASIALIIGLAASNIFQAGKHLNTATGLSAGNSSQPTQSIDILKTLESYVPPNFIKPFLDNAIISLVILALLFGFGLRTMRRRQLKRGENHFEALVQIVASLYETMEIILGWIVQLAPLAVFGVVAKSVGQYGFAPVKALGLYVLLGLLGFTVHILVTYQLWIFLYAKIKLSRFWAEAKEPAIYSFGANSSLATLPLTLKSLDNLGISRASSTLGACVGTNLNNDGIILYEAMAVLFVAQAHGLDLTLTQQITAAVFCLIAAMGVAGVPEAGFVSLSLVLATVGLPQEILPLLLTVDWILARSRSVVNVLSDMVVSIALDHPNRKQALGNATLIPVPAPVQND